MAAKKKSPAKKAKKASPARKPAPAVRSGVKKREAPPNRIRCFCGRVFDHNPKFQHNVTCPECSRWLSVPTGRQLYLMHGGVPTTEEQDVGAALRAIAALEALQLKMRDLQRRSWEDHDAILSELTHQIALVKTKVGAALRRKK